MKEGVSYYKSMFYELKNTFEDIKETVLNELDISDTTLSLIKGEIENRSLKS